MDEEKRNAAIALMSTLLYTYLPNLDEFYDHTLESYLPVLNAIECSQLKYLKKINPPNYDIITESELDNYASCALLLKDRIKSVNIWETAYTEGKTEYKNKNYDRLYKRLHQMPKLEDLDINITINREIQLIEHIIQTCKSLKTLTFAFDPPQRSVHSSTQSKGISIKSISKFIPTTNVKSLTGNVIVTGDYKLLLYLMHKFPRLQNLDITIISPFPLDHNTLLAVSKYTGEIDTFTVKDLRVDFDTVSETFREFWNSTSTPASNQYLELNFVEDMSSDVAGTLSISRNSKGFVTTFSYPASITDLICFKFIETNGVFIKDLKINSISPVPKMNSTIHYPFEVPPNLIVHILTHCPNIQYLHINDCILKRFTHSSIDFSKRHSLDGLYLKRCVLQRGVLEQLSILLPEIKQLRLSDFTPSYGIERIPEVDDSPNDPDLEFIMTHSKIDCIKFARVYYFEKVHYKVLAVAKGTYHYYLYQGGEFQTTCKEMYEEKNKDTHIYICCKSLPEFQFVHEQ